MSSFLPVVALVTTLVTSTTAVPMPALPVVTPVPPSILHIHDPTCLEKRNKNRHAKFSDPCGTFEEFDPMHPRGDVDLRAWFWQKNSPVSQTAVIGDANAWKTLPGRDFSDLWWHCLQSIPPPVGHVERRNCIAQRNARELAEHLGF